MAVRASIISILPLPIKAFASGQRLHPVLCHIK